jgi:leucyl-tRNA synthetase
MKNYDHITIEKKWQDEWEKSGIYNVADSVDGKENFYTLTEFTYPSGNLHVGHWYAFSVPDIFARYKRMQGFNVLYPTGFDAFGLPAENAAIKLGADPKVLTYEQMDRMRTQIKSMGGMFDWSREVVTCDPEYYKWTQWMFNQFLKNDLAYRAVTKVNWCPKDQTVLANEQVTDGKCERCGTDVVQKDQEQWMLRITKYADRLIDDLDNLDWPNAIKESQKNWIGRSEGSEIEFKIRTSTNPSPTLPQGKGAAPKYVTSDVQSYAKLHDKAVEMRENPTEAEEKMWNLLKTDKLGFHFRRQHIIGSFIVDFVCLEKMIVIEIDGDIHDQLKERDKERTQILESEGFNVIRFSNDEVFKNSDQVIKRIQEELERKVLPLGEDLGGVSVFTTRADTLFGVTYVVLAPEHSLVASLLDQAENADEIRAYINETKKKSELDRQQSKDKTGVELKGVSVINPANGEEVPVWIADYVLAGYGTGAVMAVPAHDERDFEFAKKYNLPIKEVISNLWVLNGENAEQENTETINRKVVDAIIKDKEGNFYFISENDRVHFVGGGIDEGEDELIALRREVTEETGFTDFEVFKKISPYLTVRGFRHGKNKNQRSLGCAYEVVLNSLKKIDSEIEQGRHELVILKKEEVLKNISWDHHRYLFERYLQSETAFLEKGVLFNSGNFDGLTSDEAKKKITEFVGGKLVSTYRLRDWGISRQRYWGCPIPIVYDPEGKAHPVPDEHLPWILPTDVDHTPDGTAPLARSKELLERTEKIFGKGWRPEVETMDTFVDSSWYFYRYLDSKNNAEFASMDAMNKWMPVDMYMGGAEHTTMHVLYSRFWTKALQDLGLVKDSEAYKIRRNRGLILGPDGNKMSKSKGNVINPDEIVELLGADTVRMYLAFMGPYGVTVNYPWDPNGVVGVRRFLERVWKLQEKIGQGGTEQKLLHKTIKGITEDVEEFKFNTAISKMMILINAWEKESSVSSEDYKILLQILAPFAPHITDELWSELGEKNSIHLSQWPTYDAKLVIDDTVTVGIQINGKVRAEIELAKDADQESVREKVLAMDEVKKWVDGNTIKKFIYVPGKIISIVI